MPQFVVDYQTSSTEIVDDPSTSTDESRNSFVQTQKVYKVGDDNAFDFKPVISGYIIENDEIGEVGILDWAPSTIILQQKVGDQYSTLQVDALLDVAVIDEQKYSFDFSDDAIGNTYKIIIPYTTFGIPKTIPPNKIMKILLKMVALPSGICIYLQIICMIMSLPPVVYSIL